MSFPFFILFLSLMFEWGFYSFVGWGQDDFTFMDLKTDSRICIFDTIIKMHSRDNIVVV